MVGIALLFFFAGGAVVVRGFGLFTLERGIVFAGCSSRERERVKV